MSFTSRPGSEDAYRSPLPHRQRDRHASRQCVRQAPSLDPRAAHRWCGRNAAAPHSLGGSGAHPLRFRASFHPMSLLSLGRASSSPNAAFLAAGVVLVVRFGRSHQRGWAVACVASVVGVVSVAALGDPAGLAVRLVLSAALSWGWCRRSLSDRCCIASASSVGPAVHVADRPCEGRPVVRIHVRVVYVLSRRSLSGARASVHPAAASATVARMGLAGGGIGPHRSLRTWWRHEDPGGSQDVDGSRRVDE